MLCLPFGVVNRLRFLQKNGILIFVPQKSECRKKVSNRIMGFGEEGKNFLKSFSLLPRLQINLNWKHYSNERFDPASAENAVSIIKNCRLSRCSSPDRFGKDHFATVIREFLYSSGNSPAPVTDPDFCRKNFRHPGKKITAGRNQFIPEQFAGIRADHNIPRCSADGTDICRTSQCHSGPLPLSDGIKLNSFMFSENFSIVRKKVSFCRRFGKHGRQSFRHGITAETDILAFFGFCRFKIFSVAPERTSVFCRIPRGVRQKARASFGTPKRK